VLSELSEVSGNICLTVTADDDLQACPCFNSLPTDIQSRSCHRSCSLNTTSYAWSAVP
jgi:hypothetical protein